MTEDEDQLRRGLRDLAQGDGPAGGLTAVETFLDKARRARARRRGAAAACAVVLIAGCTGLGLRITESAPRPSDSVAAVSTDQADRPLELGPADPQIGVAYPYDLVRSCDLRFAVFGGSKWVTDTEVALAGTAKAPEIVLHGDRVSGRMMLKSKDVARFEFGSGSMKQTLTFRPVSGGGHCPLLPPPNPAKPPVLEQSPENAVEGSWYPHGLYVHCGLRYTGFDGRGWVTIRDYSKETGIDASGRYTIVTGFMRLQGDKLRFDSPGRDPIEFRPAAAGEKPPLCA